MARRSAALQAIARLLNEPRMGFLALVAFGAGLAQSVFDLDRGSDLVLESVEWVIIALFAIDYVATLLLSDNPRAYAFSPWGLLDLAIVACPLLSLLPGVSGELRSTPILRLIRLGRVAIFGARASWAVTQREEAEPSTITHAPLRVDALAEGSSRPATSSLRELLGAVANTASGWWHVSGGVLDQIAEIAAVTGVPSADLESVFSDMSYPRILPTGPFSGLFSWLPVVQAVAPRPAVVRHGVLLLTNGATGVTICERASSLVEAALEASRRIELPPASLAARMPLYLIRLVLDRNEQVAGELERALRRLEALPIEDSSTDFFAHAFWLKRELSAARVDLWRLKGLLGSLAEGRARVCGLDDVSLPVLRRFAEDAEYLYDTIDQLRDGVLSIIDLHVNIVSFEMNRFMRLLAVASVLGLIPAVVGGLLGMNLVGTPWGATLSQVAFGVSMGMLACLYVFLARGWLR